MQRPCRVLHRAQSHGERHTSSLRDSVRCGWSNRECVVPIVHGIGRSTSTQTRCSGFWQRLIFPTWTMHASRCGFQQQHTSQVEYSKRSIVHRVPMGEDLPRRTGAIAEPTRPYLTQYEPGTRQIVVNYNYNLRYNYHRITYLPTERDPFLVLMSGENSLLAR